MVSSYKHVLHKGTMCVIPANVQGVNPWEDPLTKVKGTTLLEHAIKLAKDAKIHDVVVTSPDERICKYCSTKTIFWKPSSKNNITELRRCIDLVQSLPPNSKPKVIIYWPWNALFIEPKLVRENVQEALSDPTKVLSVNASVYVIPYDYFCTLDGTEIQNSYVRSERDLEELAMFV